MKTWFLLPALLIPAALSSVAPASGREDDREAVKAAVLDYVEGIYEVAPERLERSVHPQLRKIGFWRTDESPEYGEAEMTFEQLVALAGSYNASGRIPADAPKKVELLDVLDQTAAAKLTAEWGIDYMQLARFDGRWKIINVLWQSHPPATQPAAGDAR